MKVMAILFRVVFSIIVLLALAYYLQVSPTISLNDFYAGFDPNVLVGTLQGINAVTISLVVILLLGILSFTRILEAVWNVLFCASILVLLACGTYGMFGPGVALPHAIYNSEAIRQFCETALTYQVPIALTLLIFVAGWICASACVRVAITSVISYALWYGISEFFSYIVHLWSGNADPAAPEALNMVLGTPWVIAAVPGAFFLIYALLMSFFETFITNKPAAKAPEAKDEKKEEKKAETKPEAPAPKAEEKPVIEPKQKTKPLAATAEPKQKTLRLATGDTAPKKLKTAATAEAPKAEEKPAGTPETKEKPAETPKAEAPGTEEKPAEAPKAEEKPAELPKPEETKAEKEPKTEEKPAEESKA